MNILYAQINTNPNKEGQDDFRSGITRLFTQRGFQNIFFAYTAEELINILQDHKDEPFWLFSNFPPNSSYAEGAMPGNDKSIDASFWKADAYNKSFTLLKFLINNYSIARWNIITGAPAIKLPMKNIMSINTETQTRFMRKEELIHFGKYELHLFKYLENEVKRMKIEKIRVSTKE